MHMHGTLQDVHLMRRCRTGSARLRRRPSRISILPLGICPQTGKIIGKVVRLGGGPTLEEGAFEWAKVHTIHGPHIIFTRHDGNTVKVDVRDSHPLSALLQDAPTPDQVDAARKRVEALLAVDPAPDLDHLDQIARDTGTTREILYGFANTLMGVSAS